MEVIRGGENDRGKTVSRGSFVTVLVVAMAVVAGSLPCPLPAFEWSQDNSCVLLNACNADALSQPLDCTLPENWPWCSCSRAVFSNPVRGQASGLELGVIWITGDEQPGIGNHRVEVTAGTLDVCRASRWGTSWEGWSLTSCIPEAAGFPPGAKLTLRGEVRATAVDVALNQVDFDLLVVFYNTNARLILTYSPTDTAHSGGLLYRGRLVAGPADGGFKLEYRYQGLPGKLPALEPDDVAGPGFNVRFALSFFTQDTEAPSAYTLPAVGSNVEVGNILRKFTVTGDAITSPAEILPLGEPDLCVVLEGGDPDPCKSIEDLPTISAPGDNHPPRADVCVTNPLNLGPLESVFIECGEGRAILRGTNSTDGDGGAQGLTYLWEVLDGPEGGAEIPAELSTFQDAEVSFFLAGTYTVSLTVNDGQTSSNTDSQEVTIDANDSGTTNLPPEITSFTVTPDPPVVTLSAGTATVHFDAQANTGADGCLQAEEYSWEAVSGPAPVEFSRPNQDDTDATFHAGGEYTIRFSVDDGAPSDNITLQETVVTVISLGNTFQRCNANADGKHDLSDAVFTLQHLFLGGPAAQCRQSMNCNSDATVDMSNAVYGLNFLFLGGLSPAAPYPACDQAEAECEASTPCTAGP